MSYYRCDLASGSTINPTLFTSGYLTNSGTGATTTVTLSNSHSYIITGNAHGGTANRSSSWKVVNGTLTQIESNTASFAVTKSGETYTLRVTGGSYAHDYNVYQLD